MSKKKKRSEDKSKKDSRGDYWKSRAMYEQGVRMRLEEYLRALRDDISDDINRALFAAAVPINPPTEKTKPEQENNSPEAKPETVPQTASETSEEDESERNS